MNDIDIPTLIERLKDRVETYRYTTDPYIQERVKTDKAVITALDQLRWRIEDLEYYNEQARKTIDRAHERIAELDPQKNAGVQ